MPNESDQENKVTYTNQGGLLIIQQSLNVVHEDWICCSMFYNYYSANGKVCDIIIDGGACANVVSIDIVKKL